MSRGPATRQADIDRALKALAKNGMGAASIVIRPGGEVEITPAPLTAVGPKEERDDLAEWRARKNARRQAQGAE